MGKYVYRENGMRHISYYINMFLIYINKWNSHIDYRKWNENHIAFGRKNEQVE